jgi:class 3 adenylate cyclase
VLREFRSGARRLLVRHAGREVNTRGDDLLATFADPLSAVTYAVGLRGVATALDLRVRSGLHFGGTEAVEQGDIGGIAVHIGARVASIADAGEVLVSRTVADLLAGSAVSLTDRGYHDLKGVNGSWQVFGAEV